MRQQDKAIIWPVYFDLSRTRKMGRRISKSIAIKSPKINEIANAASKLGFQYQVIPEVSHPKKPWVNTGLLLIEKKFPKEQLLNKIAQQLLKNRSNSSKKEKK
jgi:signal recognition particle subunit SRP19